MKEKKTNKSIPQRDAVFASVFGKLKINIDFSFVESPPYTMMFTSSLPDEGKTTISVNTAVAMAMSGAKTLIIDADMRNSSVHLFFNFTNTHGLSDLISSTGDWHPFIMKSKVPNLSVLSAGRKPTNPVKFLSSPRFKELLSVLSREFEYIVIDSPPLLLVPDAQIISVDVDGVVLVVRKGKTTTKVLKDSKALLTHANVNLIGAVLNAVNDKDSVYAYGYGYGVSDSTASRPSQDKLSAKEKSVRRRSSKNTIKIEEGSSVHGKPRVPESRAVRHSTRVTECPPVMDSMTRPGHEVISSARDQATAPRVSIPE